MGLPLLSLSRRLCSNLTTSKIKKVAVVKRFTQNDLDLFSMLTGDYNPVHSDNTPVAKRMVHGSLLIAAVAGIIDGQLMERPGCVLIEQHFRFPKPCRIDEDVDINVRLLQQRKISLVVYECIQNSHIVLTGEAKLLVKQ